MKTISFGILVAALALSCNQTPPPSQADAAPGTKTREVSTQPSPQPVFTPHEASLAQQKMCDEQAAKRFREYTEKKEQFSSYTSHYDPSVNVCYVRIDRLVDGPTTAINVLDAFEGRVYAGYIWTNPQHKNYSEVAPMECDITIPGKDKILCKSSDEFNALTEKYFGVAQ